MTAAISPEGWVFIVCVLAAISTVAAGVLAAAANTTLNRYRARRRQWEEVERLVESFREELERDHDLVEAIGGGNCRVPAEERWAA